MHREAIFAGIKVLYVEDDISTQEEVANFLARRRFQISRAGNGYEGLEEFKRQQPDLVISDICMPLMDGLEMIREIKQISPTVPCIITSAYNDASYLLKAIELGVEGYTLKPINLNQLLAVLERCANTIVSKRELENHRLEQEKLIQELKAAMEKVKTLSGFIPICSGCKKIRNDKGFWEQVEAYIGRHSEAQFSHGLCPDCLKRIYPDYNPEKDGETEEEVSLEQK